MFHMKRLFPQHLKILFSPLFFKIPWFDQVFNFEKIHFTFASPFYQIILFLP